MVAEPSGIITIKIITMISWGDWISTDQYAYQRFDDISDKLAQQGGIHSTRTEKLKSQGHRPFDKIRYEKNSDKINTGDMMSLLQVSCCS